MPFGRFWRRVFGTKKTPPKQVPPPKQAATTPPATGKPPTPTVPASQFPVVKERPIADQERIVRVRGPEMTEEKILNILGKPEERLRVYDHKKAPASVAELVKRARETNQGEFDRGFGNSTTLKAAVQNALKSGGRKESEILARYEQIFSSPEHPRHEIAVSLLKTHLGIALNEKRKGIQDPETLKSIRLSAKEVGRVYARVIEALILQDLGAGKKRQ